MIARVKPARRFKPIKITPAIQRAMSAADLFVRSGRERSAAEKAYKDAKGVLLEFLAGEATRQLPDGRTITKTITPYPPCEHPAYNATTITVLPAPIE